MTTVVVRKSDERRRCCGTIRGVYLPAVIMIALRGEMGRTLLAETTDVEVTYRAQRQAGGVAVNEAYFCFIAPLYEVYPVPGRQYDTNQLILLI